MVNQSPSKPKVFISHIGEEFGLAEILKNHLSNDFLGMIDVFVSSDNLSISVGSKWLNEVDDSLKQAKVELILCSWDSVKRPWVNFEAGAGWVRGIPIVPVCHTGMRPVDLPIPLNMLQGISASDEDGLRNIYELLATQLGSATPHSDYAQIADEVAKFEHQYGIIRKVARSVKSSINLVPDLERLFRPKPEHTKATGQIPELTADKLRLHLDELQSIGMIAYAIDTSTYTITAGGGFSGALLGLSIEVHLPYYDIAEQVMSYPST